MEKFDALKALNFGVEDVAKVAECFDIIHHANGRIRLRANANLLKMLANFGANSSVNLNENLGKNSSDLSVANSDKSGLERLLSELENLPFIKSVKINKIIASVTIEYDANAFTPSIWELWLVQKDSEKVFAKVQEMIKAL